MSVMNNVIGTRSQYPATVITSTENLNLAGFIIEPEERVITGSENVDLSTFTLESDNT